MRPYPVIMSVTPYGKDKLPDRLANFFMRLSGVKFGKLNCSRLTGFESPDPVYWVQQGYAVVQADVRGMHKSEGQAGVLRQQDAEDYYDLIEWAASQPWCTGRVGLMGVSYLAMSQWHVAALKPPHLRAIVPWEGVTDLYREFAFHGGIPETKFVPLWSKMRIKRGRNRRFPLAEDFLAEREAHPLDDAYWASKRPILENIEVPALVCASWSDHGLHTRGSIEGFERISSRQKWLFTHGRKKWETFYSEEALAWQKRFLDHFLRDIDNGMDRVPKVRLEVRKAYLPTRGSITRRVGHLRRCSQPCCISARIQAVCKENRSLPKARCSISPTSRNGRAVFSLRFERAVELIGSMRLKLWVSTSEGDDLDLFVVLRKLDSTGREVFFSGYQRIRARWCRQGMAPRFTPGARPIAQHAAAPMAQPYSYSKGAFRRDCASGNRNLAVCDTLRGWIHSAVNDPRSRCGEIPCLWSSQTRQPWMAHHFHGRAVRLLPGCSAEPPRCLWR